VEVYRLTDPELAYLLIGLHADTMALRPAMRPAIANLACHDWQAATTGRSSRLELAIKRILAVADANLVRTQTAGLTAASPAKRFAIG
jgi:predicted lysophospholipase L1 biosynthesis ABC-type transport system permease subunit